MRLPVRPNLLIGNYPFSWEKATYRVLLNGDQDLTNETYTRLKICFERYARENQIILLTGEGGKLFLYGNDRGRKIVETYINRCILGVPEFSEDEMIYARDLLGSLIILIGPEILTSNDESKHMVYGTVQNSVIPSLWRCARVFSLAAFAILPDGVLPFPEIKDAFTEIHLFRKDDDLSHYNVICDSPHISIKTIRLFPDVVAVIREFLITPSSS